MFFNRGLKLLLKGVLKILKLTCALDVNRW